MHYRSNEPVECSKCNGSGMYYGAGRIENGVFVGYSGPCYACQGKGVQSVEDQKRNWGYWKNNAPRMS